MEVGHDVACPKWRDTSYNEFAILSIRSAVPHRAETLRKTK